MYSQYLILTYLRKRRDSKLTASVHLYHFLKAKLFENKIKLFSSLTKTQTCAFSFRIFFTAFQNLRKRRDSNPRSPLRDTVFPGLPIKPLSHSSVLFLYHKSCRMAGFVVCENLKNKLTNKKNTYITYYRVISFFARNC